MKCELNKNLYANWSIYLAEKWHILYIPKKNLFHSLLVHYSEWISLLTLSKSIEHVCAISKWVATTFVHVPVCSKIQAKMQEWANCKPHLHDYLDEIQMYKKNKFNWGVDDTNKILME